VHQPNKCFDELLLMKLQSFVLHNFQKNEANKTKCCSKSVVAPFLSLIIGQNAMVVDMFFVLVNY